MKKMILAITLFIFVIILPVLSSATEFGLEENITNKPGSDQSSPAVAGEWIVYTDDSSDVNAIHLKNLTTGEEKIISNSSERHTQPAISEEFVVWNDNLGRIHIYNILDDREETVLVHTKSYNQVNISFDRIVWSESRNGNRDIFLYDINNSQEGIIQITEDPAYQGAPAIWDDNIVWQDYRDGNAEIYVYNITNGEARNLSQNSSHQLLPDISENKVLWHDARMSPSARQIYVYDLTTDQGDFITTNNSSNTSAYIDQDNIVWTKQNQSIYFYDIKSPVFNGELVVSGAVRSSTLSGNVIAWTDNRNGINDIYIRRINDSTENRSPVLSDIADRTVTVGETVQYKIHSSDPDGDVIILSAQLQNGESLSTINASFKDNGDGSGILQWTAVITELGNVIPIVFSATDSKGLSDSESVIISIEPNEGDAAELISPKPGSIIKSTDITLQWTAGQGVSYYVVLVGTIKGSGNLYKKQLFTNDPITINNIPLDGNPIYIHIGSRMGSHYKSNAYSFFGSTSDEEIVPKIISPKLGTVLTTSEVLFQWTPGTNMDKYRLWVGSASGKRDYYYGFIKGGSTSELAKRIKITDKPVYVRLWYSRGVHLFYDDYVYETKKP